MALKDKTRSSQVNPASVEVGKAAKPASAVEEQGVAVRQLAARLDALVGEFVSLHMALQRPGSTGTCAESLTRLFSDPMLAGTETTIQPYGEIVPGVQIGFEPTGTVLLSVRAKENFSRSPDSCLNTIILSFSGVSRWLTLEVAINWVEFKNATHYQLGLYAQPNRPVAGHAVIRLPLIEGNPIDHRLADFRISANDRNCHRSGRVGLPDIARVDQQRGPKLIYFFDSKCDLTLHFDYLTAYFA